MAPKNSSKRIRTKKVSNKTSNAHINSNSYRGFSDLPNELVTKILSHFPEIKDEHLMCTHWVGNYPDAPNFFHRYTVLRSLSQVSRAYRQRFLPTLWERLQVCLTTNPKGQWYEDLGKTMIRKSQGMIQAESQHLRPLIRIVTVTLSRWSVSRVLQAFADLLDALPNVHTLEIMHTQSEMGKDIKLAFEGKTFPSIQKVFMPGNAHGILLCCPGVREVTCHRIDPKFTATLAQVCENLEILRHVPLSRDDVFFKRDPPLRCVRISVSSIWRDEDISKYSLFPSLRTIELECDELTKDIRVSRLVEVASNTLRSCAKGQIHRKSRSSYGGQVPSNPVNLYSDPRVVRVLHLPVSTYPYHGFAAQLPPNDFVPLCVDEFPVELTD